MKSNKKAHVDPHGNILEIRIARHVSKMNQMNSVKLVILIIIIALTGMLISAFGKPVPGIRNDLLYVITGTESLTNHSSMNVK